MRDARPEWAAWSPEVDLLAAIAEMIDRGDRMFVMAHTPKGRRAPLWPPLRVPRPYRKRTRRESTPPEEIARRFGTDVIRFTPAKES